MRMLYTQIYLHTYTMCLEIYTDFDCVPSELYLLILHRRVIIYIYIVCLSYISIIYIYIYNIQCIHNSI